MPSCSTRSGPAPPRRTGVQGYSMGMRQRLAIAAALLGDPGVLTSTSRPTDSTRRAFAGYATCCRAQPARAHPPCSFRPPARRAARRRRGRDRRCARRRRRSSACSAAAAARHAPRRRRACRRPRPRRRRAARRRCSRRHDPQAVGELAAERPGLRELVAQTRSLEEAFFELTAARRRASSPLLRSSARLRLPTSARLPGARRRPRSAPRS